MPNYDLASYRSLFPYLKDGTIYLDHASVGPLPQRTREAIEDYLTKRSTGVLNVFLEFLNVHRKTKEQIGKLINASADRIAFCDNTSNGINLLAAGFPWKTGNRVLLADIEFPANVYPFLNQKHHGLEIDFMKCPSGRVSPEDVEKAITPKTKLLSLSHVQFLHGTCSDLVAIGEICGKKDILLSVDAIQSAGTMPIDVKSMNIDFLASGGQKWLLSPEGIAFVYVSEKAQSIIQQEYMGWISINNFFSDFFRYRMDLDATARRYENGTLNVAGIVGLHSSLDLLLDVGIENIRQHLFELTELIIRRVKEHGIPLLTPEEPSARSGIVTFSPPGAQAMFENLKQKNIIVSLRERCIRLSPHFYNTKEEVSRSLDIAFST